MARRKTTEEFITEIEAKYPGKFILDRVEYKNNIIKIEVGCKKHGYWKTSPSNILRGYGCPKCGRETVSNNSSKTTEEFIDEVEAKYPGKYLLDRVEYTGSNNKIEVGCKKHGYFVIRSQNLLSDHGCPKCAYENKANKLRKPQEKFISQVESKYPGKFILDRVEYTGSNNKIEVGCKKHGYFSIKPRSLLSAGQGCPKCSRSKGEELIENILQEIGVKYKHQKRFPTCKDKLPLPFDFYLPNHNLVIEYDGIQHFKSVEIWGGEKALKENQRRDWIKTKWAKENKIKLIRFDYLDEDDYIRFILEREIDIQERIRNA